VKDFFKLLTMSAQEACDVDVGVDVMVASFGRFKIFLSVHHQPTT
jgi:hypothetical protein